MEDKLKALTLWYSGLDDFVEGEGGWEKFFIPSDCACLFLAAIKSYGPSLRNAKKYFMPKTSLHMHRRMELYIGLKSWRESAVPVKHAFELSLLIVNCSQ